MKLVKQGASHFIIEFWRKKNWVHPAHWKAGGVQKTASGTASVRSNQRLPSVTNCVREKSLRILSSWPEGVMTIAIFPNVSDIVRLDARTTWQMLNPPDTVIPRLINCSSVFSWYCEIQGRFNDIRVTHDSWMRASSIGFVETRQYPTHRTHNPI